MTGGNRSHLVTERDKMLITALNSDQLSSKKHIELAKQLTKGSDKEASFQIMEIIHNTPGTGESEGKILKACIDKIIADEKVDLAKRLKEALKSSHIESGKLNNYIASPPMPKFYPQQVSSNLSELPNFANIPSITTNIDASNYGKNQVSMFNNDGTFIGSKGSSNNLDYGHIFGTIALVAVVGYSMRNIISSKPKRNENFIPNPTLKKEMEVENGSNLSPSKTPDRRNRDKDYCVIS